MPNHQAVVIPPHGTAETAAVRWSWIEFGAVVAIGLLARAGIFLATSSPFAQDVDAYRQLSRNLLATGTYGFADSVSSPAGEVKPTAYRPPLYPLLLAALSPHGELSLGAVTLCHGLCGVATVLLTWHLARQMGLRRTAVIAASLVAIDPILLHQSTQLMTETLATLLAVLVVWTGNCGLARRTARWALAVGLSAGLAILCRPTFLPWCGIVVITECCLAGWRMARAHRMGADVVGLFRPECTLSLASLLTLALTLAPWGVRNAAQLGTWTVTTTHGGFTLLLGNNPLHFRHLREAPWGAVWDSRDFSQAWRRRSWLRNADADLFALPAPPIPEDGAPQTGPYVRSEMEDDALAYALARKYCEREPSWFLYACWDRVFSFWRPWPHQLVPQETGGQRGARYLVGLWYAAVLGAALRGAWRLRRQLLTAPWRWCLLLGVTFTLVHMFYWSNMRMRAPLVPFVSLLAAAAVPATRRR